ncbi:MAG TPA: phosphotransferase [Acidimicrobiales bacterium]|nr:phosphotransferase [Acidimicrobiales bacterium]
MRGRLHEVLAVLAAEPATLVHGDFRIENVVFDVAPEPGRPLIIDWQAVGRGHGAVDVAQIIALSLDPATRRAAEDHLLDRYAAAVRAVAGVAVSRDDLYEAYRLALVFPFAIGIAQTDMDTAQAGSDPGIWVTRAGEAVADHGLPAWLSA